MDITGEDIVLVVLKFHSSSEIDYRFNCSYLLTVPLQPVDLAFLSQYNQFI